MTTSTLDQLLTEAMEAEDNPEELHQQMEEMVTKWFAVSGVYEKHREKLAKLVKPLEDLLPSVADYEAYAAPHNGLVAGPQWNTERFYTKAAKRLRTKNPGLVTCTQCNRGKTEERGIFPELSDEEFNAYLENVELMASWWEKKASATSLDLAKSVIVHTVLANPELCAPVLREAEATVEHLVQLDARLEGWRERL